ncbi:sce7725 family protein [Lactococcus garvieae]|uniref:Sce7725 family protein n=1 Tax=Lactococcus garvieae TaxID=1363 RepID=A0AA46TVU5_9LACT|nr:sce7725 family protein [Lactococcus garvieae]UYT10323.1 sce7725 family protein [Lactococcus garvieae]UYT12346.1 sce7725 family protein [Lactococcus garvieae]
MYYPLFRGRQFEMLALKSLLEKRLISSANITPIIEPVKNTPSFNGTVQYFDDEDYPMHLVLNPENGIFDFQKFYQKVENAKKRHHSALLLNQEQVRNYYGAFQEDSFITIYKSNGFENGNTLYKDSLFPKMSFIKGDDKGRFLRTFNQDATQGLGIIQDNFQKADRNIDYDEKVDDFFSDQHLVYKENGYDAFSDYSMIGEEFIDGGFAPRAVVIHVLYFNSKDELYVKHFKSESNEGIEDPAGKFSEAVEKLAMWYSSVEDKNKSEAMEEFIKLYREKRYPGLGIPKKLSIMHHLEIMNRFLEKNNK